MAKPTIDFLTRLRNDDRGQRQYTAQACRFIGSFLQSIDPNTETAYYICNTLEEGLLDKDRFCEGLPSRQLYKQQLQRINEDRAPLEEHQKELEREKTRLRTQRRRKTLSDDEKREIEEQLAGKERELESINMDLRKFRRPENRKSYPIEGVVFHDRLAKGSLKAKPEDWQYIIAY
jgi:hypothetical protein